MYQKTGIGLFETFADHKVPFKGHKKGQYVSNDAAKLNLWKIEFLCHTFDTFQSAAQAVKFETTRASCSFASSVKAHVISSYLTVHTHLCRIASPPVNVQS